MVHWLTPVTHFQLASAFKSTANSEHQNKCINEGSGPQVPVTPVESPELVKLTTKMNYTSLLYVVHLNINIL